MCEHEQKIEFTKDIHGIKFKNDLEDTLNQNVKNLIPANIYNYLLMSASMHNNLLCESLLRSTGIDVLSKFATCAFNQGSPGLVKMNLIINYEEKERMEEYKEIIKI